MGTCPECDADIEIDETDFEEMEIGDPWDCDSCGSHLRVATLDPLEFDIDDEDDEDADDAEGLAAIIASKGRTDAHVIAD